MQLKQLMIQACEKYGDNTMLRLLKEMDLKFEPGYVSPYDHRKGRNRE
jgi:hypothetical protein